MAEQEKVEYDFQAVDEAAESETVPEPRVSSLELLVRLADWKFFILKFVVIAAALAAVVSLLWPKSYTATTKMMPPQQGQSISSAMMSQLGPLAALAGKDFGMRNQSDVFIYVLRSRSLADTLIDRFSLMSVYKDKRRTDARDDLRDDTQITTGKEGGILISVSSRDPRRAADLANAYVDGLQKLTKTLAVTEAGKRRIFFEQEAKKAGDELAQAEVAMKQTQERTGFIQLDSQARSMIESLTALHARVASQEAQVEAMRSFATPENPDLIRAQNELAALRTELGRIEAGVGGTSPIDVSLRKVPEAGLEYVRRLRDLKYAETLFELLKKQYEIARIDEAKDAALIQVLDPAEVPEIRSSPKRALIVLTVAIVALLIAVLIAFLVERAKQDPMSTARLQMLKSRLFARH
jgi:tyrosine-protein kinase Etk/Wzc